ncbi:MAG: hypothetical protein QGG36_19560 [Pirellulaceae bacterium]|jgi:hypothetical protein|nr:hypothetical protein [Pirellulaceae bacterium]
MATGIGAGIAIGSSAGQKRALKRIHEHLITNDMTIRDKGGKPVEIDFVLEQCQCQRGAAGAWTIVALVALLTATAIGGLVFYLTLN